MNKLVYVIGASIFLFLGAFQYAKAEGPCAVTFEQFTKAPEVADIELVKIDEAIKKAAEDKAAPPNTDLSKAYDLYLASKKTDEGKFGKLLVVQDNCITVVSPTRPYEFWLQWLGILEARG